MYAANHDHKLPEALDDITTKRRVTQSILVEGKNQVRVFEPSGSAPPGFVAVEPNLEDAYFVLMRGGALEEAAR